MSKRHLLVLVASGLMLDGLAACQTSRGRSDVKLIGGTPAAAGQYPATVQLVAISASFVGNDVDRRAACTASVISPTHLLTAAHCVVEPRPNQDGAVSVNLAYGPGERLYLAYGPKAETTLAVRVKAVHLPSQTVAYLRSEGNWQMESIARAHDVAIIEFSGELPPAVNIGTLSERRISGGSAFRFGGYGCEVGGAEVDDSVMPPNPEDLGPYGTRLKYAQAQVSVINGNVAEGPNYATTTKQSGCPGDSGGAVYFDTQPAVPTAGLVEIIGVNSYGRTPDEVPGQPATELGFSLVTAGTVLGDWARSVVGGQVSTADGVDLPPCLATNAAYNEALCGAPLALSCNLDQHSRIADFPRRLIDRRSCLTAQGSGYADPLGLLKPFKFDADGAALAVDQAVGVRFHRASWPGRSYLCFVGPRLTASSDLAGIKARFDQALVRIGAGEAEPLVGTLPFLGRTSISYSLLAVRYGEPKSLIFEARSARSTESTFYRVGECGVDYGS